MVNFESSPCRARHKHLVVMGAVVCSAFRSKDCVPIDWVTRERDEREAGGVINAIPIVMPSGCPELFIFWTSQSFASLTTGINSIFARAIPDFVSLTFCRYEQRA